jgi:hypothetical protein
MRRSVKFDGVLFVSLVDPPAQSLRCPACFAPLKGAVVDGATCIVGPTPTCCARPLRAFAGPQQRAEWEKCGWEEFRKGA